MKIEITFTNEPILVPDLKAVSPEIGAVLEFHGLVREMEGESALEGLFYEAYEEMAEKILRRHLEELGQIHPCERVEFIHRLGWVPVGEASMYIRVQSSHRVESLRFITESIDRLKTDVPIWKRISRPAAGII